ncbi:hypothetical protein [Chryseobacterium indologenes]|jgi:hypothetical protein|uniref:hypothetical protein n=1 Tax=Chryseobacterium indologenes TaxID=253 RepID=UPI000648EFAB|nr:hypothetical protein [Chryseobacterium indologenes]
MEKEFNPVIKAVQGLRKLAVEIKFTNQEMRTSDHQIRLNIGECGKLIASTNNGMVINLWIREKEHLLENLDHQLRILEKIEEKFKNRDAANLVEDWEMTEYYKDLIMNSIGGLKEAGDVIFVGESLDKWNDIWTEVFKTLDNILSITETYKLKLKLMETLDPGEVDVLTMDIIKHIPLHYSDEDALQYEKEYLLAYHELKESQSKKKNIWDKVMDILAGGIEETPAHRVQMKRWMEGV